MKSTQTNQLTERESEPTNLSGMFGTTHQGHAHEWITTAIVLERFIAAAPSRRLDIFAKKDQSPIWPHGPTVLMNKFG